MKNIEKKNVGPVISKEIESIKPEGFNIHGSLKNLLVSHDETVEDKIATVKTAQLIDKRQVETAFKTLMKR